MKRTLFLKPALFVFFFAGAVLFFSLQTESSVHEPLPVCVETPRILFAGDTILFSRRDLYERYDHEKISFTNMHTSSTLLIKRSNRYFSVIEPILVKYGVPEDFKYLAAIESSFNPRAVSLSKAAGIWQFLEGTGRQYGLEINEEVDERFHLEKSTEAACRYLLEAHARFGNWLLAAASYNVGQARLESELKEQECSDFFDLYLNEETSRYVLRMIMAKVLIANPTSFGFTISEQEKYTPLRFRQVKVSGSVESWTRFAAQHNCTYAQLKEANLWIQGKQMQNLSCKTYFVNIPEIEYY